jgi:3-deoxy-D-manno-octulosonic-acid transferase
VGDLADLYRVSSVAFVGGAFDSKVHNVLEPALYGPVITGPGITNSAEAVALERKGVLSRFVQAENFLRVVAEMRAKSGDIRRESTRFFTEHDNTAGNYARKILESVS